MKDNFVCCNFGLYLNSCADDPCSKCNVFGDCSFCKNYLTHKLTFCRNCIHKPKNKSSEVENNER